MNHLFNPRLFGMGFCLGLGLLLAACASTLRSNVASYHEWPAELGSSNTFAFVVHNDADADSIEMHQYQQQVAAHLVRLGMVDASTSTQPAALAVSVKYNVKPIETVVMLDPFIGYTSAAYPWPLRFPSWYGTPYDYRFGSRIGPRIGPLIGSYHARSPYYRHYGPAFYDPFWFYGAPPLEDTSRRYQRKLEITITRVPDGKRLYEVTVDNTSRREQQNEVMPYLIESAFMDFPGKSGQLHRVDLKLTK
jgi:hypothetical protein